MARRRKDTYDDEKAVAAVAKGAAAEMETDRFRLDQAAREDVIRLVRAVGRAGAGQAEHRLGGYVPPGESGIS